MDMLKTMIFTLSLLGIAVWVGFVIKAEGPEKLEEACKPVVMGTAAVQDLTKALVGFTPNWTYNLRQFMQGSCYYFFSVILTNSEDEEAQLGGVRS
jgi:hypothetical protein